MSYIILGLLLYILYKFIFGFVLPVINASRKMQQHMRNNADGFENNSQQFNERTTQSKTANRTDTAQSSKDYIDFEEIK